MKRLTIELNMVNVEPVEELLTMLDENSDCIDEPLRTKLIIWADANNKANNDE